METNNIQNKINNTLKTINNIETISVSPFFKGKLMQGLFIKKEEQNTMFLWFPQKLQLATLIGIVVLNVLTFTKLKESTYNENINQFANLYGLATNLETSVLN